MKRLSLIFLFLNFTWSSYSQTSDTLVTVDLKDLPVRNGWIFESTGGETAYRLCNGKKCDEEIIDTFENGSIKRKAFYVDGNINGTVTDYYPNGQIVSKGKSIKRSRVGEWIFYYKNGNVQSEIVYQLGWSEPKSWIDYFESGQIESKHEFSKDKYPLYHYIFNEYGDTVFAYYSIDWDEKTYEFYEKHDNGQIKETGQQTYIEKSGWKKIGIWKWYDKNGKLEKEISYDN